MVQSMTEQAEHLNSLVASLPATNSYKSVSQLSDILTKYIKVLDYVNSYNQEYKSATTLYYADIAVIRDYIQVLLNADSEQEKDKAFSCARHELKIDLHALATLIKPLEQPAVV